MKFYRYSPVFLLLLTSSLLLSGSVQLPAQKEGKSYYFEDDEVVFEFDIRLYQKAEKDGTLQKLEFSNFDIHQVAVSGNFNKWSKKAWKMKQIGPYTYQLRKKLKDFTDKFDGEFKFLINGRYWADPNNWRVAEKLIPTDIWEGVYNLDVYNVVPVEKGNAAFFLKGFADANEVVLAGSFNGWKTKGLKMKKVEKGWAVNLELPVGRYEYKFIVDGNWIHDPDNPDTVVNEYSTLNSVLLISRTIDFELAGFLNAKKVILAGTFNDWNEYKMKMDRTESGWKISLNLSSGKYAYKFIVDGQWMIDPDNPLSEYDPYGNLNSILMVQ